MNKKQLSNLCFKAILVLFLASCSAPISTGEVTIIPPTAASTVSELPTIQPTITIEPTPLPPEHRIAVRVAGGVGEFYDRATGEKFIPRGSNYIRLAKQQAISGELIVYHSTFNAGLYDPDRVDDALRSMHADGYNTVRVFIQGSCKNGCIGNPDGGLSKEYIANVVDFLHKAKKYEIYVILTTDAEPGTKYYIGLLDTTWSEDFGGVNKNYLTGGGVLVGEQFWQDFIAELIAQEAPLDSILAYQLRNEFFFETNAAPFILGSGVVKTANGKTYDLSKEENQQRMMDENLVYWTDQIRAAIREIDPTALVSVGFFPPDAPNPWASAPRFIRTYPAVWQSSIDFLDFHPYPGGYSLDKLVENFGMAGLEEKPILMGEFGASLSTYSSAAKTANVLHDWQVESCKFGFDGWLLWTWDSDEQTDFYNGLSEDGQINQALSPISRPDPCRAGNFPFFEHNLAIGKSVLVSQSLESNPGSYAVDGTSNDWWGAGNFAPQWIEIDLEKPMTIKMIRMVTSQSPEGNTRHQLWVGPTRDAYHLLHTFEGFTSDLQALEFIPENPIENVRYVKVVTSLSPSWVSWREIEVIAP